MKLIVLAFVFNFILKRWPKTNIIKKKITITSQSPRKYCYFDAFKIFLSKIKNGDPQLLFHIFKVKYLKIMC